LETTQQASMLPAEVAMFSKAILGNAKLPGVALGILMVLGSAGVAGASDRNRGCEERIAQEQRELDRAIAHHGNRSWQAEHERRELARLRDECRTRYRDSYRNSY
jgi:hypothetical protein